MIINDQFCKSLSSLLTENSDASPQVQDSKEVRVTSRSTQNIEW